jgi:hypothetical protein
MTLAILSIVRAEVSSEGPLVEFGGRQIPLTSTDKKTNLNGGAGEEHAYAPVMGKSGTAPGVGPVCKEDRTDTS